MTAQRHRRLPASPLRKRLGWSKDYCNAKFNQPKVGKQVGLRPMNKSGTEQWNHQRKVRSWSNKLNNWLVDVEDTWEKKVL